MNVIIDYNGNPVLSVYGAIDTYGVRWAIIAENDEDGLFWREWRAFF